MHDRRQRGLSIGFVGAGRVGTAMAVSLYRAGYRVVGISDISRKNADRFLSHATECRYFGSAQELAESVELIFITTSDDAIFEAASSIVWRKGQIAVHCSGAASLDLLEKPYSDGALTGSFHPCQAFAGINEAISNLPGSTIAIEAQMPLIEILKEMADSIECGHIVLGPGDKALYHAAAVFASNYYVTLLKVAADLFETFGVRSSRTIEILMPLIEGNLKNIKEIGLPRCLTGPISRGDIGTIRKHLECLENKTPQFSRLYAELALQTLPVAKDKGTLKEPESKTFEGILRKVREQSGTAKQ